MSVQWKDATSYSKAGTGRGFNEREPQTWSLESNASLRVSVTRHLHGEPDHWYLRCDLGRLDMTDLGTDLEDAKAEAVRAVKSQLRAMLGDLD